MSHGFGADLRWRVLSAISEGLSTRKAAKRFGIGISTAGEWFRRYRDDGETTARKQGQPPGSKLDRHEAFILGLVEATPDISLAEIAERLLAERSVSAVPSTVWEFFNKRGITFKKNGACKRTATRGRESGARSLVRRAARSRSRKAHIY